MAPHKFSIRELLAIEACTNCQLCVNVCPAVSASLDGGLSAVTRLTQLKGLLKRRHPLLGWILRRIRPTEEPARAFGAAAFRCTLCGSCQEVCPVGIRLKDLWVSVREECADTDCAPAKLGMIGRNLRSAHNVFAEDQAERAEWVEDLNEPPRNGFIRDKARVVYFTGCVSSYFPLAQKIPQAFVEILTAAGVDFTLLGEDEWCCGYPLLGAGMRDEVRKFVAHNGEAVRRRGADEVVFSCPSCYQMWREHYPGDVRIFHATQYLQRLIRQARLPLKTLEMKVTYHDPCDLGRGAGVFDPPREILRAVPGVELVELPRNRNKCTCCGGGGNLEMVDPDLAARIAKLKTEEILSTGAQAVITSCQQCVRSMMSHVRRNKLKLEVLDIVQFVRKALKQD